MSDGVLYVEILPSTKGIGKAVEKDTESAFRGAEKSGSGFFSKLTGWAKTGALVVGGMVAAVGALAVGGGISRALNIEDAQAKLKGLGHDTQAIEAIMTDALASVKGTAFGLDAAATTAAAAVASGIKPGKELERYLRLTADAATIAGVSMEEMGSIINKVQAKGKAQMEDLNRLTERGIPIMQWLADEYGVTADAMSEMVSRGEVDAETFRRAIENNIGGAALSAGDTTRGAFANMMAALSRLGEVFVGDGLSGAKTFFNEVTVILDGLAERFKPWVEKIQERLGEAFEVDGFGDRFLSAFDRFVTAIESGPIPKILAAIAPVLPALMELSEILGAALGDAAKELGEALAPVLPMLAETLVDAVIELTPSLVDLLEALIPLIPSLVELAAAVVPLIPPLVELLIPALQWATENAGGLFEMVGLLVDLFSGGMSAEDFIAESEELGGAWGWAFEMSEKIAAGIVNVVTTIQNVAGRIGEILEGIRVFFEETWATIGLVLGGALQVIVGLVTGDMEKVKAGVSQALTAISDWWNNTWSGASTFLSDTWTRISSSVSNGVNNVMSFIQSLPGKIMGALSGAGSWLVQTGKDIIQGLINGVTEMINKAVGAVKDVGGAMLDGVKGFLGIKSPSRVFRDEVGKMVGLGLLEGVGDAAINGRIDSAVQHMVNVPSLSSTSSVSLAGARFVFEVEGRPFTGIIREQIAGASSAAGSRVRQGSDRRF